MSKYETATCPVCDSRAVKIDTGRLPKKNSVHKFFDTDIYSCTYCGTDYMVTRSTRKLHKEYSPQPFQMEYKDSIQQLSFSEYKRCLDPYAA